MKTTKEVLGTLITWMAQSSNSPISMSEATTLLDALEKADKPEEIRLSSQLTISFADVPPGTTAIYLGADGSKLEVNVPNYLDTLIPDDKR